VAYKRKLTGFVKVINSPGCGAGRDLHVLAQMVGRARARWSAGTPGEQIAVALRHREHRRALGS